MKTTTPFFSCVVVAILTIQSVAAFTCQLHRPSSVAVGTSSSVSIRRRYGRGEHPRTKKAVEPFHSYILVTLEGFFITIAGS
jgi:hypothetical protein